eukprot:Em0024g231a
MEFPKAPDIKGHWTMVEATGPWWRPLDHGGGHWTMVEDHGGGHWTMVEATGPWGGHWTMVEATGPWWRPLDHGGGHWTMVEAMGHGGGHWAMVEAAGYLCLKSGGMERGSGESFLVEVARLDAATLLPYCSSCEIWQYRVEHLIR